MAAKAAAAGGSFAPDDIAGLRAWYDASDAATIHATGGLVDTWDDKSSYAYHATATSTARPTTGANTKNGLNVLTFDGGDRLIIPTVFTFGSGQAMSTYVVMMKDAVSNNTAALSGSDGVGPFFAHAASSSTGAPYSRRNGSSSIATATANVATTAYAISHVTDTGGTTNAWAMGFNGANTASASASGVGEWKNIGYYGSAGFELKGRIAEILIYDTVLGTTDAADVLSYLNTKWAVY